MLLRLVTFSALALGLLFTSPALSQDPAPVEPAPLDPQVPADPAPQPDPDADLGEPFTIAVCTPITGSAAAFGDMVARAARLKSEQLKIAGGLRVRGTRHQVTIAINDDRADPDEARQVATRLVADQSVLAVVGHFNSACTLAARDIYNEGRLVEFTPSSTNPRICRGAPYTFRNLLNDSQQAARLADHVHEVLRAKKIAVIYDNDDYGRGMMTIASERAKELGMTVAAVPYMRERTQDFEPIVRQAMASGPTALLICGLYNEGALIARAMSDLGFDKVQMVGGDGLMSDAFIETGGKAVEGVRIMSCVLPEPAQQSDPLKEFIKAFKDANDGKEPDIWAALTYDALGQVLEAIRQAGLDRRRIRAQLAMQTSERAAYHGVTGPVWFDEHGDCVSKPTTLVEVRDGAFHTRAPK
ncbi:MAG: ABC transporter substrate-binding protein [Planctomycetota bacterium]